MKECKICPSKMGENIQKHEKHETRTQKMFRKGYY